MKVYTVVDDGNTLPLVVDLAELGRLFLRLSNKHPESTWYWVTEENI